MSVFEMYFQLGFAHIADLAGYDHILFIITLCSVYFLPRWKELLVLITAFTLGHTLTLALATLNILNISSSVIEFLIPLTILITALSNIFIKDSESSKKLHYFKYAATLFFGLIHGLGFSNYLRMLLGQESDLFLPLLSFNVGLEVGQIFIVSVLMLASVLFTFRFKTPQREWNLVFSGSGLGVSLVLLIERFPGLFS